VESDSEGEEEDEESHEEVVVEVEKGPPSRGPQDRKFEHMRVSRVVMIARRVSREKQKLPGFDGL